MTAPRASILRLIPPPLAADARVGALLQAFEAVLDDLEARDLMLLDPADVREAALPALAWEHSLDEFVGPEGLPVPVMRDMIIRAWDLHEPKGYAEGVEGGVAMLGYPAELTQWWQETPQALRGTHRIEVRIDQPLFPDQPAAGPGTVAAIWRMIRAMQRWSQDHGVRIVSEAPTDPCVGVGVMTAMQIQIEPWDPGIPEVTSRPATGAAVVLGRTVTVTGWKD